jgi:putative N6-adenine-specific DNA methylase
MSTRYRAYITVSPGLEDVLSAELEELLGSQGKWRPTTGGLEGWLDRPELWKVAHQSRTAEGVRIRIGRFEARTFEQLVDGFKKIPLRAYISPDADVKVQVASKKSKLIHSGAVAERVEKVIERSVTKDAKEVEGKPRPPFTLMVRIFRDKVTISVAAGERLHRRGYRQDVGAAPLRETLAAACLRLAGDDGTSPFWDPFCGSGTFLAEALETSRSTPGLCERSFAFESWPTHDADAYGAWKKEQPSQSPCEVLAWGSDTSAKELAGAKKNLERAVGDTGWTLMEGAFKSHVSQIPKGALIVTNPPYGKRAETDDAWISELSAILKRRRDLKGAFVLTPDPNFGGRIGLPFKVMATFSNGGLKVRLWGIEGA